MRELAAQLPHEQLIYLGDTARLPYGNKSPDAVRGFALDNAQFLLQHHTKLLIIACHTACCHAFDVLQAALPIPVIGVTKPGVKMLVQTTKTRRVAVLGTASTIASGLFQRLIQEADPSMIVYPVACPLFVPLVEEGMHMHASTRLIVEHYLAHLRGHDIDAALLACTHYPLLAPLIQDVLGSRVRLIFPAVATALEAKAFLDRAQLLNPGKAAPQHRFFASDDPEKFQRMARVFFPQPIEHVEGVNTSCEKFSRMQRF